MEKKATGRFKWSNELDVRYILGFIDAYLKAYRSSEDLHHIDIDLYEEVDDLICEYDEDDISDNQWKLELGKAVNTFRRMHARNTWMIGDMLKLCRYIQLLIDKKKLNISVPKAKEAFGFDDIYKKYYEAK